MFFSVHGFSSNLNFSKSISLNSTAVLNDSLYVEEKNKKISNDSIVYPEFFEAGDDFLSEDLIIQNTNNLDRLYKVSQSNIKSSGDPFKGLNTAGSISRGINLGNNRNSVLNSELDLQIYGKLNDKVEITASIQDANIPLQDNGYSQTLDEFDQIFIELKSDKWKIRAGDIDLKNSNTYFGMFSKRIQGLLISAKINDEEKRRIKSGSGSKVSLEVAKSLPKMVTKGHIKCKEVMESCIY